MDINNLIAFIEVANKKSFSRSAESLKLTQPAVSKRVAALESELSTKLFDRVGRTIHLTEAGRVLLPSARQISAELSRIENVICNLGDEVSGTLCIGTTEYIATHFMPDTLKTFHKNYPKVALELKFANSQETLQALESGVLELALCSLPEKELRRLAPKLNQDPIWSDNLVFVASTDHPLTKSDYVDLTGLANYPAILPYAPSLSRFLIDEAFNQKRLKAQVSMEASDFETMRTMASIGIGWACLPESQLDDTLSVLEVDEVKLKQVVSLLCQSERTLSNSAIALLDLLPGNISSARE